MRLRSLGVAVPALLAGLIVAAWLAWTPDRDRAMLEATYLQAPTDLVDLAPWRLHVRDSGPRGAPAVVLIHGFGASLHSWEAWVPTLAQRFRVIRIDLPGSGLSLPDPAADYSDARTSQLLVALLQRLGVARASLIGHSIGGRIAWTFAAQHPEYVDRLVLVAPDGFASPGFEYGKAPEVPASLKLMRHVLPAPLLRMSLVPAYADPKRLSEETFTRYQDLLLGPGVRGALIARMEQTVLVNPVPLLQRIAAPTLLLWGDRDALIPIANSADYLRALRSARLETLPDVGHVPQEEAPERSLAAVIEFLR
jgi:pimeloyl-ACP methyl ester carboxylesterase